jgi:hypothetical protein
MTSVGGTSSATRRISFICRHLECQVEADRSVPSTTVMQPSTTTRSALLWWRLRSPGSTVPYPVLPWWQQGLCTTRHLVAGGLHGGATPPRPLRRVAASSQHRHPRSLPLGGEPAASTPATASARREIRTDVRGRFRWGAAQRRLHQRDL